MSNIIDGSRRFTSPLFLADLSLLFVAILWGASYAVAKDTLVTTSVAALGRSSYKPTYVGFLMGTEPLFGAVFAILFLGEVLTLSDTIGAIFILCGTYLGARLSHTVGGSNS